MVEMDVPRVMGIVREAIHGEMVLMTLVGSLGRREEDVTLRTMEMGSTVKTVNNPETIGEIDLLCRRQTSLLPMMTMEVGTMNEGV